MTDETTSPADRMAVLYPNDVPKTSQPAPVVPNASPDREATLYPADQPGAQEAFTPHGAPIAYSLTAPEGLGFNKAILDEMTPVLRELNLSDAGANRLMPLAAKFHERILTGQADEYASMQTD